MADRKQHIEDKVKPGINFVINFPVRFNISTTTELKESINEYCKKHKITTAEMSREMIFKFFETDCIQGMLKNNRDINKSVLKIGETIKDEMGVDTRSFSVWYRDAFDILNNE